MKKVNRIEVIDQRKPFEEGGGRKLVIWEKEPLNAELHYQDDNHTLKIIIPHV